MVSPARTLQQSIEKNKLVMIPGAFDALSARLVQQAGFEAVYMTGFGATASRLGSPDVGLMSQTEMTTHARDMARAVSIPIIADADTGYGGPSNIHRTVLEYLQAGVAAIHLEDQMAPKRCGQMAGIRLMDAQTNALRLRCAIEARGDDELLIIARTDAMPTLGAEETVDRAHRYLDAGADYIFVDGIKTIKEAEIVARRIQGPKIISIVDGNELTALSADDLRELGFSMALYAVTLLFSAVQTMTTALSTLQSTGRSEHRADALVTYQKFCEIVDLEFHQKLGDRYEGC